MKNTYIAINTREEYQVIDLLWIVRYMATEGLINKGLAEQFICARNKTWHLMNEITKLMKFLL